LTCADYPPTLMHVTCFGDLSAAASPPSHPFLSPAFPRITRQSRNPVLNPGLWQMFRRVLSHPWTNALDPTAVSLILSVFAFSHTSVVDLPNPSQNKPKSLPNHERKKETRCSSTERRNEFGREIMLERELLHTLLLTNTNQNNERLGVYEERTKSFRTCVCSKVRTLTLMQMQHRNPFWYFSICDKIAMLFPKFWIKLDMVKIKQSELIQFRLRNWWFARNFYYL
jgi:hypothetical protein